MTAKFDLRLILIFFLVSFGIFLFPATTKGGCSSVANPPCGSHYGIICSEEGSSSSLNTRSICLPWQAPEFKIACGKVTCNAFFLGCKFNVSCTKPPANLRYYDNPNYPTNPFLPEKSINAANVSLPVKLAWDNVEGWKDGWVNDEAKKCFSSSRGSVAERSALCLIKPLKLCQEKCDEIGTKISYLDCGGGCDAEGAPWKCHCVPDLWRNSCKSECPNKIKNGLNFYQISITGELKDPQSSEAITEYKSFLNKPEFIPPSCSLKLGQTYQWQVRACSSEQETSCGSWSNLETFTTGLAPELVSPYDPDWAGEKGGKDISLSTTTLDWCDIEEAQSYRFKVYIIEEGEKVCHPKLLSTEVGIEGCDSWLLRKTRRDPEQIEKTLYSDFPDENMDFFTKNTTYSWQVAVCDENGLDCGDYSQLWTFNTEEITLDTSLLVAPTNDPTGKTPVGLPLVLDWSDRPGVNSFIYEVVPASGGQAISEDTNVSQSQSFNFPQFSLNTPYKWKVKSCWDYESKECEPDFSEEWYFKTTGQAPSLTYPASGEQNVVIPVNFIWENVPGAKSYILKVSGDKLNLEKILDKPEFSLDFPEYLVSQEANYSWQVKTCAWDEGKTCGQYSNSQSFKTFRLLAPQNPSPEDNGQFFTGDKYVAWEKVLGAKAYQYQIKYLSLAEKEIDETCPALVGKNMSEQPKTALANSDFTELKCLGGYQWQVRSCLDNNCLEVSNWSNPWSFTLLEGGTGQNGLVPCGRLADDPKTPWNEREPCQIKHLFLSVKIIIDFLLFRVAPIILVLLTIATGLIFYTSFGQITTMAQVISLWKAAGIGLVIIFFAWTIVNIFLKITGYDIGVFGNWYQLPI